MALLIECPKCKYRQGADKDPDDSGEVKCIKCKTPFPKVKTHWIEYYAAGRRKRERIGTNKALAETVLKKRLVERAEDRLLDRRKLDNTLFSDIGKKYDEWSQQNNKSYHVNKKHYIGKVRATFDSMLLREITPWHIEQFKLDRAKETGKVQVNREIATVKHMLSKAVEWGKLQANPARSVKKFRETKGRVKFLMPDQFKKLYEHLPSPLNMIASVAVLTGLRKDNILSMKWPCIDSQNKILNIPETKNSDPLKLPMSQPLIDLLDSIPKNPKSDYVFSKPDGERYQNICFEDFRAALKKADLDPAFHFHDLRHTAASHLVMSGTDLATVAALLGHKDISMTMRYAHLSPDHKRKAIDTLGQIFRMDTYMDTKVEKEEKNQ